MSKDLIGKKVVHNCTIPALKAVVIDQTTGDKIHPMFPKTQIWYKVRYECNNDTDWLSEFFINVIQN